MRLALIHALRHSPPPIEEAFARLWPGQTLMNLLQLLFLGTIDYTKTNS
jgi:hypothetical protein